MRKRNLSLIATLGVDSNITAQNFFTNTNPLGLADATAFLDYYQGLNEKGRLKFSKFWEALRASKPFNDLLTLLKDSNGVEYTWVNITSGRLVLLVRVPIFTAKMFEFLMMYADGKASVRCSFNELLEEAQRIEEEQQTV